MNAPFPANDPRDAARFRVFRELARRLGADAVGARDFPARVQRLLASDRRLGSRDRRLQRELLFSLCRHAPWTTAAGAACPGGAEALAALLADCPPGLAVAAGVPVDAVSAVRAAGAWNDRIRIMDTIWPAARLSADALAPEWFRSACADWRAYCAPEVLFGRPPLWLRLSADAADSAAALRELAAAGAECAPSGVLPEAWRTEARVDLAKLACFARGFVEVQDLGSQLILGCAGELPRGRWLDACAGAGGKTLQLAALLGSGSVIDAEDPREAALGELRIRARRAGLAEVRTRAVTADPSAWGPAGGSYDGILVDAPCSGTGTWRRHPHLRLCSGPEEVGRHAQLQAALLASRARALRPGGLLVYATCSLCEDENERVVGAFLSAHPEFSDATPATAYGFRRRTHGLVITPWTHDTDGFYLCALRRREAA